MIEISENLTLPIDLITQKSAILARTGAGKTNAAVVITEEVLAAKQQIVAIDPKGDWWGLRSSADGKAAGFSILVLGGDHGDLPLEPTAGEVIADLVVDEGVSAVLDVSEFSNADRTRFVTAFAERLYRRKSQRPDPMLLIFEEADEVCPQRFGAEQAKMVGAIERIVKRGRFRGIGTLLITQRSASLNKDVLTQSEILIVMQTTGPQDIKAIDAWIEHHPDQERRTQLLGEVSRLKQGEAFLWSPSWLDTFRKVRFRLRHTFDAGQTPRVGERRIEPKILADIDMNKLRERMASTIEKAKAEDPKELRREIADLRRQLAEKKAALEIERVEVPILNESEIKALGGITEKLFEIGATLQAESTRISNAITSVHQPSRSRRPLIPPASLSKDILGGGSLPGPQQRILDALAWLESIGISPADQTAVAFLAGYTVGGGAFNNPRGSLKTGDLIDYRGGRLVLTDAGRKLANTPEIPLTTEELQQRVLDRLPGPEQKILKVLISAYPKDLSYQELAERSGYQAGGGAFNNPRGRLRSIGLIDYPSPGRVVALPVLFLEERGAEKWS